MPEIPYTQLDRWKKDCLQSSLNFLEGKSSLSDRDKEAYRAGFMQGWVELRNCLTLHNKLAIDHNS
jgi:hypothetical protein